MKKKNKEYSSRRNFMKKIVAGGTLAATSGHVNAAPPPKPGSIIDHPANSKFKGKRKTPGWLPDTTEIDGEYVFLDEALYLSDGAPRIFDAFPVPNRYPIPDAQGKPTDPPGDAFAEPTGGTAERWNQFNTWILGGPFNKKPKDSFDHLLEVLADHVRKYNAALYWMRRQHLHENHGNDINKNKLPPRNPGNPDESADLPPPGGYEQSIQAAQQKWKKAVFDLKKVLSGTYDPPIQPPTNYTVFKNIWADFIRVNDYIVSMRVIAEASENKIGILELGGSSSSHISISSAFKGG
jgi:hypothetical protein